ncbi:MAG: hypothetical protein JO322_15535 [Candidatus Eremiobacteraeota bacterium]|nr:hypothetical protein [Candidatus Eremiobacteraeota bacterium]
MPASAQDLQRLTVTRLTLSANTVAPKVEGPFDLVVTAHVRERVMGLRNLDLPILASELDVLGDEHSLVSDANGTTYTEDIRVVAHHSGLITIAPVTLDAIDARDGRAKRYSSNSLALVVGGGVLAATQTFDLTGVLFAALRWLLILAVAVLLVRLLAKRPRKPPPAVVPAPQPAPVPMVRPAATREERLRDARTVLEAERTRQNVLRIRTIVREMVGASDAETLADVLRRLEPEERLMRALLFALERAAFTHDDDLDHAIDRVILRLNDLAGSPA